MRSSWQVFALQSGTASAEACSQVFNAVGLLNLPDWYNAGRVAQLNSFAPFSERHLSHFFLTCSACSCRPHAAAAGSALAMWSMLFTTG